MGRKLKRATTAEARRERQLDEALEFTFPASDPIALQSDGAKLQAVPSRASVPRRRRQKKRP
jgi:hypothetical protein